LGKKPKTCYFRGKKTWKTINYLRVPDFQTKLLPVPFWLDTYCFWMFLVRFWWKILRVFMMLVVRKIHIFGVGKVHIFAGKVSTHP